MRRWRCATHEAACRFAPPQCQRSNHSPCDDIPPTALQHTSTYFEWICQLTRGRTTAQPPRVFGNALLEPLGAGTLRCDLHLLHQAQQALHLCRAVPPRCVATFRMGIQLFLCLLPRRHACSARISRTISPHRPAEASVRPLHAPDCSHTVQLSHPAVRALTRPVANPVQRCARPTLAVLVNKA